MPHRLDWNRDGADWPNREASRFVRAGATEFHVQDMGPRDAPAILLAHGTGASCHSFRDLAPLLAAHCRVIAPDLPGHGFTRAQGGDLSLPGMASALARLLEAIDCRPFAAAGHSAGAAVLLKMGLDGAIRPARLIGFNSALKPIEGEYIFSPLAKALFLNPFVPRAFSSFARHTGAADRLLDRTGSRIDRRGRELYARLLASPAHVAGALGMMASWELEPLRARLGEIDFPVTLVAAEDDAMVPASVAREAATRIPGCELVSVPRGGHLLHEADPQFAAGLILERVLPPRAHGTKE